MYTFSLFFAFEFSTFLFSNFLDFIKCQVNVELKRNICQSRNIKLSEDYLFLCFYNFYVKLILQLRNFMSLKKSLFIIIL